MEKAGKAVKIGIVGSEAIKFTFDGELKAKRLIRELIAKTGADEIVSGGCHLGGIDIWAEEIGRELGLKVTVFKPENQSWEFYKKRNLQIADTSDIVYCITVNKLPNTYKGMTFKLCYHCKSDKHVKSGGCWTMHRAKEGHLYVIQQ